LFMATSISWGDLRLILRFMFLSTKSWNLSLSVEWRKSFGIEGRIEGQALTVRSTAEWSEQGSKRLVVVKNRLRGDLDTNMSSMSGFLRKIGKTDYTFYKNWWGKGWFNSDIDVVLWNRFVRSRWGRFCWSGGLRFIFWTFKAIWCKK
jgi:hypothetical protein